RHPNGKSDNKFHQDWSSTINCQRVEMEYEKHFIPLESDPQVFTSLMHNMGAPKYFKFIDIWSLEPDQLDNIRFGIQNPVEALFLILPDCPAYAEKIEHGICKESILWLKQTINNACGLYAILHCVCNTLGTEEIGMISCFTSCGIYIN
ncbi:unnamed protein product, partial [Penicillium palitans]